MLMIDTTGSLQRIRKAIGYSACIMPIAWMLLQSPQLFAQDSAVPQRPAGVVDSAAQASPIAQPRTAPAVDSAVNASPVSPESRNETIPIGASLQVVFQRALDSASVRNGEIVHGVLKAPVRTSTGRTLAAGTDVVVTVVSATPAGKLTSAGTLTLQVERVGNVSVFSNFVSCQGKEGARDMPDSNPAKGTEATLTAETELTFEVPALH